MKTYEQKSQTQLWNHLNKARLFANGSVDFRDKEKIAKIDKIFDDVFEQLETLVEETA